MDGLGHQHEDERQDERNHVNPECIPEQVETNSADECAAYVTAEQRARLGCRRACKTEQKDGGAAE